MTTTTPTDLSNVIWNIADSLRGAYKQSDYGKIILPFAVLRRIECVMEPHIGEMAVISKELQGRPDAFIAARIRTQTHLPFHNTSGFSLNTLSTESLRDDLADYLNGFSNNVKPIFQHFNFEQTLTQLHKNQLLSTVIGHFVDLNLSPNIITNRDMGLIFEHLIRKFAESSNETAGEHYTPRDIVNLTTQLVMAPDKDILREQGEIRRVYDGCAGTGGFLSAAQEMAQRISPGIDFSPYGQELNPQSYAIGMADLLLLGQNAQNYKRGNTLSDDQFHGQTFHYGLTNPPFGVNWGAQKPVKKAVDDEHKRGFAGRFGAGLPTVRDGSLLFLQNMLSKMTPPAEGGGRVGIILSGSPLFNGSAGSGESNIRRWILENDFLEAIVALPTDLFYNTGIGTYIWILSNHKEPQRKNKVQLIDATELHSPMRKSLGSKRKYIRDEDAQRILDIHAQFQEQNEFPKSKIFNTTDFGYRKITIHRPLRLRFTLSADAMNAYAQAKGAMYVEELADLEGQTFDTFQDLQKAANFNKITATAKKLIFKHFGVQSDDAPIVMKNKKTPEVDTSLNETENVPLHESVQDYFAREVLPHVPDAWIDESKTDDIDGEIGIVGYEINFNRYFYEYQAPRPLEDIDADLRAVEAEIAALLKEVIR